MRIIDGLSDPVVVLLSVGIALVVLLLVVIERELRLWSQVAERKLHQDAKHHREWMTQMRTVSGALQTLQHASRFPQQDRDPEKLTFPDYFASEDATAILRPRHAAPVPTDPCVEQMPKAPPSPEATMVSPGQRK